MGSLTRPSMLIILGSAITMASLTRLTSLSRLHSRPMRYRLGSCPIMDRMKSMTRNDRLTRMVSQARRVDLLAVKVWVWPSRNPFP